MKVDKGVLSLSGLVKSYLRVKLKFASHVTKAYLLFVW